MLLLFRPLIKLDIAGSGVLPRDICFQAAEAVSTLVDSYAQLYTLQRTPSFVPYFVLASTMMHGVSARTQDTGTYRLQRGVDSLKEMTTAHGFASHALKIINFFLDQWNISIPTSINVDYSEEELSGYPPTSASTGQFCPSIGGINTINNIGKVKPGKDPIFLPFPFQGRPLLDAGPKLKSIGFSVLPEFLDNLDAADTRMDIVKSEITPGGGS